MVYGFLFCCWSLMTNLGWMRFGGVDSEQPCLVFILVFIFFSRNVQIRRKRKCTRAVLMSEKTKYVKVQ